MIKSAQEMTEEFQRQKLAELLEECSENERNTFDKCYPKGVKTEDLLSALNLVIRTLNS